MRGEKGPRLRLPIPAIPRNPSTPPRAPHAFARLAAAYPSIDATGTGEVTEEEAAAHMTQVDVEPRKTGPPPKYGIGSCPCFCCGSDQHSWVQCPKKRKGRCAVCGDLEHFTRMCTIRYQPSPSARVNVVTSIGRDQLEDWPPRR